MAGTTHFPRMKYNVERGLRELVAPRYRLPKKQKLEVFEAFAYKCGYCGLPGNEENRGLVLDHHIPVTEFGELVLGNAICACQRCNAAQA